MTLGELFKIMDNPDLIRVKRGNEVLYAGFLGMVENKTLDGYDFERVNAPEDAEIKKIRAVPELRHRNYKALELEPPLKPDIAPKYKFSDLQMQLHYDIYIYRQVPVVQSAERPPHKRQVVGSSPTVHIQY